MNRIAPTVCTFKYYDVPVVPATYNRTGVCPRRYSDDFECDACSHVKLRLQDDVFKCFEAKLEQFEVHRTGKVSFQPHLGMLYEVIISYRDIMIVTALWPEIVAKVSNINELKMLHPDSFKTFGYYFFNQVELGYFLMEKQGVSYT